MVREKHKTEEHEDGTWSVKCSFEGCSWEQTSLPDKQAAMSAVGNHVRHTHKKDKKEVKTGEPKRHTFESARVEVQDLRDRLSEAGVGEKMHDGICRYMFEHGQPTPRRLNEVLKTYLVPYNQRKLALDLLWGEGTFRDDMVDENENPKDSLDASLKGQYKKMKTMVELAAVNKQAEMLFGGGQAKDEKRSLRRMSDGSMVSMTDKEYADYKVACEMDKRSGAKDSEIAALRKDLTDNVVMKELQHRDEKLHERLNDIEARVAHDDFDKLRMLQEKSKRAGLTKTSQDDWQQRTEYGMFNLKMKTFEKVIDKLDKLGEKGSRILEPAVERRVRKFMQQESDGPPKLTPINEGEMEAMARRSEQFVKLKKPDSTEQQKKKPEQEENGGGS